MRKLKPPVRMQARHKFSGPRHRDTPMKNPYRQFRWRTTIPVVLIFLSLQTLLAQQPLEGVVRIKVDERLASRLEASTFTRSLSGEVVTGVQSLDQLSREYKVRRFTRVFPHAGKNEMKHRRHNLHLWYEVSMDKAIPVSQLIRSYQSDAQILRAEPVYEKSIIRTGDDFGPTVAPAKKNIYYDPSLPDAPNDPMLASQWHYHNTGQTGGTPGADIRLFDAWKTETGNRNVIIAVMDGGIQTDHPDLAANLWVNGGEIAGNNIDDDNNGYIDDIHGYSFVDQRGTISADNHGTHVAGTIAAVSNNGIGVAGIAGGSGSGDGVRLMSCAVFQPGLSPNGFAQSYVYSADNGAVISQNSWGYTTAGVFEQVVLDAIDYFVAEAGTDEHGNQTGPMKGGLVIFSTGNANEESHYYPAYYAPVLAVASSTHKDIKAQYSNYGAWVDITAPGGETSQTSKQGVLSTLAGSQYGSYQGTSMACPHVSGTAGLVLSKFQKPGFSAAALRERLRHSVDNIDALNPAYAGKLGTGRVNAGRALLQNDTTPPEPVSDLAVAGRDIGEIVLTWTSPADESGFVAAYDVRYSTAPITGANFSGATPAVDVPAPNPPGTGERFAIHNLPGGVLFYFAVRSVDFEGNVSTISNVASETTSRAPSIQVSSSSVSESLLTAQRSERHITISNSGAGSLEFTLKQDLKNFAMASPQQGSIDPGGEQVVTIIFDAAGLPAGTYKKAVIIEHNDPEKENITLSLTLRVTDNGAPIASVNPSTIDFKGTDIGTSRIAYITVSNAGSDPLLISEAVSLNTEFTVSFTTAVTLQAFEEKQFRITYSPATAGHVSSETHFKTNDPAQPILKVNTLGEGLREPAVVATPNAFAETLEKGERVTRTMVLYNNGSHNVPFRLDVTSPRVVAVEDPARQRGSNGRIAVMPDSTATKRTAMRKKREGILAGKYRGTRTALHALRSSVTARNGNPASGRKTTPASATEKQYATGFEDFTTGDLGEQNGWFTTEGFTIADENANAGLQHLRGTSFLTGSGEQFALSPALYGPEEYDLPRYSSIAMRVNLDRGAGNTWEIVPQDGLYVATRIRFNPDGSIEAMVIDQEYETHWKKVPVTTPKGYFDLAIEYDSWASDASDFPTYLLFINNRQVFAGTGLAAAIGQVAFVSQMEATGPVWEIDELRLTPTEYIPAFVRPDPASGTLAAGGSVNVALEFDASELSFGAYQSDVIVYLGETDSLTVPAALTVTGLPGGKIAHEVWTGVPGKDISAIPVNSPPTSTNVLTQFESPQGYSDNYGSRIRGYVQAPSTGYYHFWVASNDHSELWLSTDEKEENKRRIAFVTGYTNPQQWNKYSSQLSGPIHLEAHRKYYIEALHKEGVGSDHLAVGWQLPDESLERPIPGSRLTLYGGEETHVPPQVNLLSPREGEIFSAPATIAIQADAVDADGTITKVEFFNGGTRLATDISSPYLFNWQNVSAGNYSVRVVATDNSGATDSATVNIRVTEAQSCVGAGHIMREQWNHVTGSLISSIPVSTAPGNTETLTAFESPANIADNYGARIRGFICVPATGQYTFWIASNDKSELWLSTDSRPENKVRIAAVSRYTDVRQWTKYPEQESAPVNLIAGQKYYIEALHKEGLGTDHLSVGWRLPDGTLERPLPGIRLMPFENSGNEAPVVALTHPANSQTFSGEATVDISAEASDPDGSVLKVAFYNGTEKLGEDTIFPYAFTWTHVTPGDHTLTAVATDNEGMTATSAPVSIYVQEKMCAASGTITREYWTGVAGNYISDIPVDSAPEGSEELSVFEGPVNAGSHYAARIRGYLCPPASGDYYFWIASNDHSELWLSTDADPLNKVRIAFVSGATGVQQWDKSASQRSVAVRLTEGKSYYIEALHKQGVGTDHVAVGWQLPDGVKERPISGNRLSPFKPDVTSPGHFQAVDLNAPNDDEKAAMQVFPNPLTGNKLSVILQNYAPEAGSTMDIDIKEMTGVSVYAKTELCANGCSTEIDLDRDLLSGVYILRVRTGGRAFTQKLIVP